MAHLLSIYDEYISSYRDRSAICDPAYGKRLVGMGAALAYVIVVDGRIVGTWRRTIAKREVRIELTPEQKKQIKETAGEEVNALEFTIQQLEERVAPRMAL